MKYTEEQKQKLYQDLLPHIFVEGGALIVRPEGQIDYRLNQPSEPWKGERLIVSTELLSAGNDAKLTELLSKYFIRGHSGESEWTVERWVQNTKDKLRDKAVKLAAIFHIEPYTISPKMQERRERMAYTLAYCCPEEAELLYYQQLSPYQKWPVLLPNNPIPSDDLAYGEAVGQMRPDEAILICRSNARHHKFKMVPEEVRTTYEEIIHFADYIIRQQYIRYYGASRTSHTYLSQYLLSKNHIETVLEAADRYSSPRNKSVPLAATKNRFQSYHGEPQVNGEQKTRKKLDPLQATIETIII